MAEVEETEEIGEVKVEEVNVEEKVKGQVGPAHQDTPQTLPNSAVTAITPTAPTRGTVWHL